MSTNKVTSNSPDNPAPEYDPPSVLFTRLYWSAFGPLAALLILIGTAQQRGWLVALDLVYVVLVALIPLVRWIEIRLARRRSLEEAPEASTPFQKYVLYVFAIGAAAWIVAKILGNLVLTGTAPG
jgi:hypothetical protein